MRRTKWKRQNQLRLDQLRQQSADVAESDTSAEYGQRKQQQQQQHRPHATDPHGLQPLLCRPEQQQQQQRQQHRLFVPTRDVETGADGEMRPAAATSPSLAAAAAAAAFIGGGGGGDGVDGGGGGGPYQGVVAGVANGARWNFLTTAAAIVRNVSYVHGCHL